MDLEPFALLAHGIVLLPTPWAAEVLGYRTLFRKLHADPVFCRTAFGPDFKPLNWSDAEMREFFHGRDIALRWKVRGMGDFAIGILPEDADGKTAGDRASPESSMWQTGKEGYRAITGDEFKAVSSEFDKVDWVGYTCVRDAITSGSITGDPSNLPPWQQMIEIRYGMDPGFRGKGICTRATQIVMHWAVVERGAERFVSETVPDNVASQKMLTRLGFTRGSANIVGGEDFTWTKQTESVVAKAEAS